MHRAVFSGAASYPPSIVSRSTHIILAALVLAVPLACFAVPLASQVAAVVGCGGVEPPEALTPPPVPVVVASPVATALVPLAIALFATILAWPAAWWLRSAQAQLRPLLALLCVPMLMPSSLAYAGAWLARAPGTPLGNWINHLPPDANAGITQGLALLGLALWAWPLATFIIAASASRIAQEQLDALALTTAQPWDHLRQRVRMCAGGVIGALVVVYILMRGSPVPLHLAQVPTDAVELWALLALDPSSPHAWRKAASFVLPALAAAVAIAIACAREHPHPPTERPPPHAPRHQRIVTGATWMLAVLLPILAFVLTLRHPRLIADFWIQHGGVTGDSLLVAAAVGAFVALLTLASWFAAEQRFARGVVIAALAVALTGLLVPGVLTGAAIAAGLGRLHAGIADPLAQSPVLVAVTHLARFGGLGIAAGVLLQRTEHPSLRDARRLAGGDGLAAWLRLAVRPSIAPVGGVAVAAACLSLHEIESTVQVQPPGYRSLAQVMLDHLHMNSIQELAAAGANLLFAGLLLALLAGWLLSSHLHGPDLRPDASQEPSNR